MRIVVIGGSGLIGSRLVTKLDEYGHETVVASLDTGVNTLTGEGLADAVGGKEQPARSRSARPATPPIRPTQRRAAGPKGAPGLLLCQEARVCPCNSWSSSDPGA